MTLHTINLWPAKKRNSTGIKTKAALRPYPVVGGRDLKLLDFAENN